MEIKTIIFDFDGVLIDSYIPSLSHQQDAAQLAGLPVPSFEILNEITGPQWNKHVKNISNKMQWPDDGIERFHHSYGSIPDKNYCYPPFEGVIETLLQIAMCDIPFSIVSNRNRKSMLNLLKLAGIDKNLFLIIQGADDYEFTKPDPKVFDLIFETLGKHGVTASESLFVGDTLTDYATARDHEPKIHFVGITSGLTTFEEFQNAGVNPMLIMDSIAHLNQKIF